MKLGSISKRRQNANSASASALIVTTSSTFTPREPESASRVSSRSPAVLIPAAA